MVHRYVEYICMQVNQLSRATHVNMHSDLNRVEAAESSDTLVYRGLAPTLALAYAQVA